MPMLQSSELAVTTFLASSYSSEACGSNGLPLTPSSICILGKFQFLKTLKHPYLCEYVDIVRGKHERLYVVNEHFQKNLKNVIGSDSQLNLEIIYKWLAQLLEAIVYLNNNSIVHRCLCPEVIQITDDNNVKVSRYGFYYMTNYGNSINFPLCEPKYMPPEVITSILQSVQHNEEQSVSDGSDLRPSGPKCDSWTIGIILIELYLGRLIWKNFDVNQILSMLIQFVVQNLSGSSVVESIFSQEDSISNLRSMPGELKFIIESCLEIEPSKRLTPSRLLETPIIQRCIIRKSNSELSLCEAFLSTNLRCRNLRIPEPINFDLENVDHLRQRSISEIYYLWKLIGGDIDAEYRRQYTIKTLPPISTLPTLVVDECKCLGVKRDRSHLLDHNAVILSLDPLRQRLENVTAEDYIPLIETGATAIPKTQSSNEIASLSKLPLVIREKDVEYQLHRIVLLRRLLEGYPYKRAQICKEARIDIPPMYRPYIWAALLGIDGDIKAIYDSIDKETPTTTDRQIEVDIPRCHQYDELLSSPTGHAKFKRLLKAWVVSHPQFVYWQGLDSLCAPFLYLNFDNEALAYSCLSAFIPKYLHKFFLKDNSAIIQEYLAVFAHLITFHDPELHNHLDSIGFIPELYAIPWFLTMYTHVFPLSKIFHLWDTLLLGNPSFPLCIGVAILNQLRSNLLSFGFNECILLFSDMPEIDIERCVNDSIKFFCNMPKSVTYRQHENTDLKPNLPRGIPTLSSQLNTEDADVESVKLDLGMDPLTLDVLRSEISPRISAEDVLDLLGITPGRPTKQPKIKLTIVDIRSSDEFNRGAIPSSINIPFCSAFNAEDELQPSLQSAQLESNRGKLVVVIGNRGTDSNTFAKKLIKLEFPKVCVLHKGIDVLRLVGVLVVPSAN